MSGTNFAKLFISNFFCIVLFYFWVPPEEYATADSSIRVYASKLLLWESNTKSATHASRTSVIVAVSFLLGWLVISSFPLAYGGNNKERRLKIFKMQYSALFNFFSVLLSQLMFVWLVFTLLVPTTCIASADGPVMATSLPDPVSCGDGGYANWAFRLSLPLLIYFFFTCTMLHSNADMVELINETNYRDSVPSELNDLITGAHIVSYDQFYSRLLQSLQMVVCVTCSTGLASADKIAPLTIVVVSCFVMAAVPVVFLRCSCKLAPVVGIRSVGALLACWTGIICMLKTIPNSYPWATSTALYIGWLCIAGVGVIVVSLIEYMRHKKWVTALEENNLAIVVESLVTTVEKVINENMVVEASLISTDKDAVRRNTIDKIRAANSFTAICEVMMDLERIILAERLTGIFLSNRATWHQQVSSWNFTGSNSISYLHNLVAQLRDGLRENNPLAMVSRNVLSITLRRKCPEEIAWEIYGFLFDSANVRRALDIVINNLEYMKVGTCSSPHIYKIGFTSTDVFWTTFDSINRHRSEMMKIVVNDNSLYGKSANSELPRPQLQAKAVPTADIFSSPHNSNASFNLNGLSPSVRMSEEESQILMDRRLAEQFSAVGDDSEEAHQY